MEKEVLQIADYIHIDDRQQDVYSMKIADLLVRTVIEIEAISKELYLLNGGPELPDQDMYFDTVCLKYLDYIWNLDSKEVLVVSPVFYFEDESNKTLRPLHKSMKRGTSSSDWNKAYQAVKHNRAKELNKGSFKHLIHALAALLVLILYYRDDIISGIKLGKEKEIDCSFGSSIFAVKVHSPRGLPADGSYTKHEDYDSSVFILDPEPQSLKEAVDAMQDANRYTQEEASIELEKLIQKRLSAGLQIDSTWVAEAKTQALRNALPIKDYALAKRFNSALTGLSYNLVLNKKQY